MSRRALSVLLLLASTLACGAHPRVGAALPDPKTLREDQAVPAIREALIQQNQLAEGSLSVRLGEDGTLEADVHFGSPPFAIAWTTAEDRAALGALLPAARDSGPIQVLTASTGEQPVQVLVLDAQSYAYEGNPLLVERGAPSLEEAERRLRRDVTYFVEYVRDQHQLAP